MMIRKQEFQKIKKTTAFLQTKLRQCALRKYKNKIAQMSVIDDLKMQIRILQSELEKQDVWLMKAKRLLQMYENKSKDSFLNNKATDLLQK